MVLWFGARVEALPDAPCAGSYTVRHTDAGRHHWLFENVDEDTCFQFGNYEHVASVPAGATALAVRDDSPAQVLDYGGEWVSVQFHPEMSASADISG